MTPERRDQAVHQLVRLALLSFAVVVTAGTMTGVARLIVFNGEGPTARLPAIGRPESPAIEPRRAPVEPSREPVPSPTVGPAATARQSPTPAVSRFTVTPYSSGGRSYSGVSVTDPGLAVLAPFGGIVQIRRYQYIDNDVRVGSNVPSLPFFPYVTLVTDDRRLTYRPGALGIDTELLARDGDSVAQGDPLFRVLTTGRSSWATFYDRSIPFQIVVSLQALPSGRDLDPSTYIAAD